jgi:SNF2 family DNA or RNA helicase
MDELRPYQQDGAKTLAAHRYWLLGDDPGLGKSAQAVTACDLIGANQILVLCPAIARPNWANEFQKFSRRGHRFSLAQKSTDDVHSTPGVICSYDLSIVSGMSTKLLSRHWDCVILDESQYLNNRKSKRTRFVYGALRTKAKHLWGLSGTPAKNQAGELWPMLSAFGVYSGTYWEFVSEFLLTKQTPYGLQILGHQPAKVEALKTLLGAMMLRRRRDEVMKELPPLAFYDVVVEPSPVKLRLWYSELIVTRTTEDQLQDQLASEIRATETLMDLIGETDAGAETLAGLQVKTQKSRRYVGLQKAPSVAKLISEELQEGAYEKIVLFAWHRDVVESLRLELAIWHPETLFGGTLLSKRTKILKNFKSDPRMRVLICNITAAGIAIDLTAASEVGFVEASYVPADNAQAVLRVHRFPQTQPVRVRFFSLYKHVDHRIHSILKRKTRDLVQLFDAPPVVASPASPAITPDDADINPFE